MNHILRNMSQPTSEEVHWCRRSRSRRAGFRTSTGCSTGRHVWNGIRHWKTGLKNYKVRLNIPKQSCVDRLIVSDGHVSEVGDHVELVVQKLAHVVAEEAVDHRESVVLPTELLQNLYFIELFTAPTPTTEMKFGTEVKLITSLLSIRLFSIWKIVIGKSYL